MTAAAASAPDTARLRWRVGVVLLVTLALHAWVFGWASRNMEFELPPPARTMTAELFTLPAPVTVGTAPAARPAPRRAITPPAPPPPAADAPAPQTAPATDAVEAKTPEPEVEDPPSEREPAPPPVATASGEPRLQSVLVSFPKVGRFVSDTLAYQGLLRLLGTTTIEWRINGGRYSASSETRDDSGRVYLTLTSEGRVEPDIGVAPERYLERRLSRAPTAANFQWDAGKVTFSANSREFPLRPGVQDQLSFLAQLAVIAQAFPERLQPGAALALEVASARDVRIYDMRVVGWEAIRTEVGVLDTLKIERLLPEGARDVRIELWLAPTLNWLPARTRTILPNDQTIETVLREVTLEN